MKIEEKKESIEIELTIMQLKNDIMALFLKHNLSIIELDIYNGIHEFIRTDKHFVINGKTYHNETINEILNGLFDNV